jgi:hypothetical protein
VGDQPVGAKEIMYAVMTAEWIKGTGVRFPPRPHPWIARLEALDRRFGFKREFVKGVYDYTYARKSGGRGIYVYFALKPGYYEVFRTVSWNERSDERYFIQVNDIGEWHKITREEVIECLKNTASESAY